MPTILVAADAAYVRDDVIAALSGEYDILVVDEGRDVRRALTEHNIHMAVVDMQIGSMGGIAVTMDMRLEESGGRIGHVPVLLLLDRRADVFLARRAGAEGFLIKPISPLKLRKAVRALMDGGDYEDTANTPSPLVAQ